MVGQEYISSFSFDRRLAPYDIEGSAAHVRMLARRGLVSAAERRKILAGLETIARDLRCGKRLPPAEDIHFAIENELIRRIGETGKKMHTARSRNDQVALDLKLFTRDHGRKVQAAIRDVQKAVLACASRHAATLMPGFTHLQHGQPIFFAHHVLAYGWMLERDRQRFADALRRLDECPLGACALAGTALPIDRHWTARALGFAKPTENSIDTVADRDFIAEFLFACALTMTHLSRLAEELVIWSSAEFDYVRLSEEFTSGSSIMPQKRNPDTAELLRGKAAGPIAGLVEILSILKNQPLAYNRDLQQDKPCLFSAADTTLASLTLAARILESLSVNAAKMERSCDLGHLLATELADYLARKGMPFRAAHKVVANMVKELTADARAGRRLSDLSLEEFRSYSPLFQKDVVRVLSATRMAERRNSFGGTGRKALSTQFRNFKALISKS